MSLCLRSSALSCVAFLLLLTQPAHSRFPEDEAARDPYAAVLMMVERKADTAYRFYAVRRVAEHYFSIGDSGRGLESIERQARPLRSQLYATLLDEGWHDRRAGLTEEVLHRLYRDLSPEEQDLSPEDWMPHRFDSLILLAHQHIRAGHVWKAAALAQQAEPYLPGIAGRPLTHRGDALASIGCLYLSIGQIGKGERFLHEAHSELSGTNITLATLSRHYARARLYQRALAQLDTFGSDLLVPQLLRELAEMARFNGDRAVAADFLRRAASASVLIESDVPAEKKREYRGNNLYAVAVDLLRLGEADEAFALVQKLFSLSPSPDVLYDLAWRFKHNQEQGKAEALFDKASRTDGDKPASTLARASASLLRGDRRSAFTALAHVEDVAACRSQATSYQRWILCNDIANLYFRMGEQSEALRVLNNAMNWVRMVSPDSFKVIHLGHIAFTLGKHVSPLDSPAAKLLGRVIAEYDTLCDFPAYRDGEVCTK